MKAFIALTLLLILQGASSALAANEPVRVLVSVGELNANNLEWRKAACANIHKIGNEVLSKGVQLSCRQDSIHVIDTYLQQLKADNQYHIRLLRGFKGSYRLSISNWNRSLDTDFITLGWTIGQEPHTAAFKDAALNSILTNFFLYLETEEAQKVEWLLNARWHSKAISFDFQNSTFKSTKDRRKVTVNAAAGLFAAESSQHADYLRSRQEIALINSVKSPQIDIFTPQDSLLIILEKAARESRNETLGWQRLVTFDEKGMSLLTAQLLNSTSVQTPADSAKQILDILPTAVNTVARTAKKTIGALIYLF